MNTTRQGSSGVINFLKNIFGRGDYGPSLRESLEEVIEEHEEETPEQALGDEERVMLFNIINYGDLRVDDVMVPRADIVAAPIDTGFDALIKQFSQAGHSRLPVYRDELDELLGMVHVKDALKLIAEGEDTKTFRLANIQRPVIFVSPSMKVIDLLAKMRAARTHMAIVVDEYGGTDGLVTIEDLVEQIVGDIEDEHDAEDVEYLTPLGNGNYDADARLEIEDLADVLGIDLLPEDWGEDVDTLGGFVFKLAGSVPEIGDVIMHDSGYKFEVVNADPRRIIKVRIHALKKKPLASKQGEQPVSQAHPDDRARKSSLHSGADQDPK